jgi:hypothetical protein
MEQMANGSDLRGGETSNNPLAYAARIAKGCCRAGLAMT